MNFHSILNGKLKGTYIRNIHLPISILSLIFCFLLAGSTYQEFSFLYDDISYLGNANLNPNGFIFWSIGMAFAGFMILLLIPSLFMRLNQQKNPNFLGKAFIQSNHSKLLKKAVYVAQSIGKFFIILFPIGMIGLGVFQEAWFPLFIHQFNATLAFGGLFLGIFFIGFTILFSTEIPRVKKIFFSILGWLGPLAMVISQGFKYLKYGTFDRYCGFGQPGFCDLWFVFSVYEWILFFSAMACVFIFFYIFFSDSFDP